jgi:transcriptional regulator with XRE-family HTH domain
MGDPFMKMQKACDPSKSAFPPNIGLLERGKRSSNLDTAQAIAKGLGVPLSQLIKEAEKTQERSK